MPLIKEIRKIISTRNISAALVTRVQWLEAPFLNEFLAYYRCLGINRFYLVNTEPQKQHQISSVIAPKFQNLIEWIPKSNQHTINECTKDALPLVKENFLLQVDIDEFLYLNGHTISEFIIKQKMHRKKSKTGQYHFLWLVTPLSNQLYADSIGNILQKKIFVPSRSGKSLVKIDRIKGMESQHYFSLTEKTRTKNRKPLKHNCFIFHFASRGIYDSLNRMVLNFFGTIKDANDAPRELEDFLFNQNSKKMPNRFIILAYLQQFQQLTIQPDFTYPALSFETDTKLLESITMKLIKEKTGRTISPEQIKCIVNQKIKNFTTFPELLEKYAKKEMNLKGFISGHTALSDKNIP